MTLRNVISRLLRPAERADAAPLVESPPAPVPEALQLALTKRALERELRGKGLSRRKAVYRTADRFR